jgi:hypothetical protein
MTSDLLDKAKLFDLKLQELWQLAKEIQSNNYLGEGNKWKKLEELVSEIMKVETEFACESLLYIKRYEVGG